jgi:site-specific DNA-methyltransferase (adenine-specific)
MNKEKYQVIYADPPWHYNNNIDRAAKNSWSPGINNTSKGFNISEQYSTMNIQQLKDLSIDPYQVIYADPPWSYKELFGDDRTLVSGDWKKIKNSGVNNYPLHYSGMKLGEISSLPIKDIIAEDAACFMWTTDAHLPYAMEIMKAWGFIYKTIGFVWVKKEKSGKQVKMLAPWTNKGAELCLFGTKGAMTKHLGANDIFQVHEAKRREHSRKPDIIRDEIKRMFPDCKRIELFARTAMPGWDAWGNEVDKFTEPELKPVKNGLW